MLTPEVVMDAVALTEIRTSAVSMAGMLDRLRVSSEPLECVIVGAGMQGRAHARTVVDVLERKREMSVTFVSRSKPAGLPHQWVESGSTQADGRLGWTGLVVVTTSVGNPWSSIGNCDLMRPCLPWGRTPWTRGSCTRMCCGARR